MPITSNVSNQAPAAEGKARTAPVQGDKAPSAAVTLGADCAAFSSRPAATAKKVGWDEPIAKLGGIVTELRALIMQTYAYSIASNMVADTDRENDRRRERRLQEQQGERRCNERDRANQRTSRVVENRRVELRATA